MVGEKRECGCSFSLKKLRLIDLYDKLYTHFGPQGWWPADTPFEMIVGAVLTQNTSWSNVEKAIDALKDADALTPERLLELKDARLESLVRSSGYFRQKAKRLKSISRDVVETWQGDLGKSVV